jgi:Flp pilus assembly protein TadB
VITAVLAAATVWCLVPGSARGRTRRLWSAGRAPAPAPDLALVAAALSPVAGLVLAGWPLGLVAGLLLAPVVRSAVGRLESEATRRRDRLARRQLPAALDLISAALAAGRPPGTALALAAEVTAAPLGPDLASLAHRVAVAGDVRSAAGDVAGTLQPLTRALRRAEQSGVPVGDVIAAVAADVRREHQASRRERGRQVGVRTAAPLGLCFMPAFLLIGIVPTIVAVASNLDL